MVKLGIIGMGRMGTFHATQAAELDELCTVAALVDNDVTRISDDLAPGALRTTDASTLLSKADIVDAVVIATPTSSHYALAQKFLSAGVHVLVEKPITPTLAQARTLFDCAQKMSCALHIGHVERHNYAFLKAQEILRGTPELIQATRSGPFHERVACDSVVLDLMIHDIDLVCQLADSTVQHTATYGATHRSALRDSATAVVQFANGTLATLAAHRNASCGIRRLTLETPQQHLTLDFGAQTVTERSGSTTQTYEPPVGHNPLREQLRTFLTAATTNTNLHNAAHDGAVLLHTLTVQDQAAPKVEASSSAARRDTRA